MKIAKAAIASSLGIDPSSMNKVSDGLCHVHQKIASSLGMKPRSMNSNLFFDIYLVNLNNGNTLQRLIDELFYRIRSHHSTLNLPYNNDIRIASTNEYSALCEAFFLTDLAEQMTALILEPTTSATAIDKRFAILEAMALEPKHKLKMVSRGIVSYLARFATRGDSEFRISLSFLDYSVQYLAKEDITKGLVDF